MDVSGKMQVDIFHRDDLGVSAAGRAAFLSEDGSERRFSQSNDDFFADFFQTVGKTARGGRLSFSCGSGGDGCDQFNGGTKRNVIPFSASCSICVPEKNKHDVVSALVKTFDEIKEENKIEEPGFTLEKRCSHHGAKRFDKALDADTSLLLTKALFACPHGVFTMSKAIPGIVETSDNLAIVKLNDGNLDLQVSVRSSVDSAKYYLVNRIRVIFESFGIDCTIGDGYPAWTPDPDSQLARFCAEAYEQQTGKKAVLTAIHAGLECSVINSKCPGMDSVSIGPQMYDIHSTAERLSISSCVRTYDFLKHLLSIIR